MALKDDISADLLEIESDLGNPTFTWDTIDYICSPSSYRSTITPVKGTYQMDRLVQLVVRTNLFPDSVYPEGQQFIQYKGKRWQILTSDQDVTGAFIRLTCVDDTQGVHG